MNDTATAASTTSAPLTALDRCDACGAQAYVRVLLDVGEFLFCAHHAQKHGERLRPAALAWHDETDRLHASSGAARTHRPAED